jgi:hypothetical protein
MIGQTRIFNTLFRRNQHHHHQQQQQLQQHHHQNQGIYSISSSDSSDLTMYLRGNDLIPRSVVIPTDNMPIQPTRVRSLLQSTMATLDDVDLRSQQNNDVSSTNNNDDETISGFMPTGNFGILLLFSLVVTTVWNKSAYAELTLYDIFKSVVMAKGLDYIADIFLVRRSEPSIVTSTSSTHSFSLMHSLRVIFIGELALQDSTTDSILTVSDSPMPTSPLAASTGVSFEGAFEDASIGEFIDTFGNIHWPQLHHTMDECVICFDAIQSPEDREFLPCTHSSFHKECIHKWIRKKNRCPICRLELSRFRC